MERGILFLVITVLTCILPASAFAAVDEVQWNSYDAHIVPVDNGYTEYILPFAFPFYGRTIKRISINTNGLIELLEEEESCTLPCDAAGTHSSGVPPGMDAIFIANDDLTTGVIINGFADKVIISFIGSTTVDADFFNDTIQMQVTIYRDGRIRWYFYSMYYFAYGYDLFSGIHTANGTELAIPVPQPYWPDFDLYESYEFNGTEITATPFDEYDNYLLVFDDAYREFPLSFVFPFFDRGITSIAVNTNGLIELREAGESAGEFIDDEPAGGDGQPDEYPDFGLFGGDFGTHYEGDHITKNIDALFLANDDLISGALINMDSDMVIITLMGVTWEDVPNNPDQSIFDIKPIQMQVILFSDGSIRWNFFHMNYSASSFDIFSGLYDEVDDIAFGMSTGTPQGINVLTAFEYVVAPSLLLGDVNEDGFCDISDVLLIQRMALGLDAVHQCSDINGDTFVDVSDVILTLRMSLELDPLQVCM